MFLLCFDLRSVLPVHWEVVVHVLTVEVALFIGKILNDEVLNNNVSVASANIANFTGNASLMIYDFRKNPKKYLTIQLKLF